MKPLNKKERSKAFIKVVGLFLLSFVIAILLGFSTMNVGKLAEQKTSSELERLKNNLKFQEEVFAPHVGETTEMLSKITTANETGENLEVLNQDIAALLSRTKNQVEEDETWESKMYKDVIQALSDLQLAYNNQVKLREQMGDSDDLGQKLQACITERDRLQTQLSMLQAGGGGGADVAKLEKDLKDTRTQLDRCNLENRALKQEIERVRNR
jgi:uncharacterized membrane-anchored protein YhcB (DUF1043 family)